MDTDTVFASEDPAATVTIVRNGLRGLKLVVEFEGRTLVNNDGYPLRNGCLYEIQLLDDATLFDIWARESEDGQEPNRDAPWEHFQWRKPRPELLAHDILPLGDAA